MEEAEIRLEDAVDMVVGHTKLMSILRGLIYWLWGQESPL